MEFIAQTKNIYNRLEDNLSKTIFENRLLYSLTDNIDFIKNVAAFTCSNIEKYKDKMNSLYAEYDNIIVYGAGHVGLIFLLLCDKIKVTAFCDSDKTKQGKLFYGYSVISPEELKEQYPDSTVIVTTYSKIIFKEIEKILLELSFKNDRILNLMYAFNECKIWDIYSNLVKEAYFDSDIILSQLTENETFIDAGSLDLTTSIYFAEKSNYKYKEIIAFEPNPVQFPVCVDASKANENVKIYPYGLWNENTKLSFYNSGDAGGARIIKEPSENTQIVNVVSLDNILDGEKASFIKMDVEGAELTALIGAKETIKKYHPKLAISLYHKPEDIWEIPSYILPLNNEYKIYIRHYTLYRNETVLYAV